MFFYFAFRYKDEWELQKENLVVCYDQKLGSGAFGDVYMAKLIGNAPIKNVYNNWLSVSHFQDCEVAVKVLPPFANEASKHDFHMVNKIITWFLKV